MGKTTNYILTLLSIGSAALLIGCGKSEFDPLLKTPAQTGKIEDLTPSPKTSTINISAPNMADGINPATVTIYLKTADLKPVAGVTLKLTVSGQDNVIVPCTVSNEDGKTECWIYSSTAEMKEVSTTGDIELKDETVFIRPPVSKSSFGIVSSGSFEIHSSGAKVISVSGITETNTRLYDSNGIVRVKTALLNSITEKR